jgi:hypothetical protein
MRANEFINEAQSKKNSSKMDASAISAIPGASKWNDLDNSSPYHAYRFGIGLAGSPELNMELEGPIGQKTMTIAYSDADKAILDAAGKSLGFAPTAMTGRESKEHDSVHKVSPHVPFKGYPR